MIDKKKVGGREGIRTPDPLLAKQVLCQLSYTPLEMASFGWASFFMLRGLRTDRKLRGSVAKG